MKGVVGLSQVREGEKEGDDQAKDEKEKVVSDRGPVCACSQMWGRALRKL